MARLLLVAIVLLSSLVSSAEVPTTDAELGKCSAAFKVTDANGNPVYNANVHFAIERKRMPLPGFFTLPGIGTRRTEVQVKTDSNGEAKINGLPEKVDKELVFDISKARFINLIVFAPEDNCHPTFEVRFE